MRRISSGFVAAFMLLLAFATPARAATGDVDTSFGTDGFTITNLQGEDHAYRVAIQPDGKIVVVGSRGAGSGFAVLRYTTAGVLDPTFAGDGIAASPFKRHASAAGVAVTPEGRIVVVGTVASSAAAVAAFAPDGSLDRSFSRDGVVTAKVGHTDTVGLAVALQSNGKILVGANAMRPASQSFGTRGAVFRFTSAGVLDPTFSGDGKTTFTFGEDITSVMGIAVTPDGSIVAAGYTHMNSDASVTSWAVARLTSSGELDPTFSTDGKRTVSFGTTGDDYANDVAIQPNGMIVVVGSAGTGSSHGFGVVRLTTSGALDPTFGANGKVLTTFDVPYAYAFGVAIEADAGIVVAGATELPAAREVCGGRAAIVRYLPSGALDPSFGHNGVASPTLAGSISESPNDVALQADGKIVIAGTWQMPGYDVGVARLEG